MVQDIERKGIGRSGKLLLSWFPCKDLILHQMWTQRLTWSSFGSTAPATFAANLLSACYCYIQGTSISVTRLLLWNCVLISLVCVAAFVSLECRFPVIIDTVVAATSDAAVRAALQVCKCISILSSRELLTYCGRRPYLSSLSFSLCLLLPFVIHLPFEVA